MDPLELIIEKDRAAAAQALREGTHCTLGMMDGEAVYLLPLNYGYQDGFLCFHSGNHGHKLDVLRDGKRASFSILTNLMPVVKENPCSFSMRYHSLRGEGTLELLNDRAEILPALDAVVTHYSGTPINYPPDQLARLLVYRLKIESMSFKAH